MLLDLYTVKEAKHELATCISENRQKPCKHLVATVLFQFRATLSIVYKQRIKSSNKTLMTGRT